MPRCCVPGCDTGTSAEIVRTRKAKARNKSTFLLPADYKLFRKWDKVLGLKYDTVDGRSGRVCELHFDEADIMRHFYKQMEDGSIKQFTFSRPTLKKGIIPLTTPREEEFKPQIQKNKKSYKVSKAQNSKDHVPKKRGRKRKSSMKDDDENDEEYISNKRPRKNNDKKNPIKCEKRVHDDDDDDEEHRPNKRPKKSSDKKAPKNYEKRKYKRQIKPPRNKLISNSAKKNSLLIYTFDKLLHNLNRRNSKLPKGWEFGIVDDDTVKFVYTSESPKYFLTCSLKRDRFLEIRAFNTHKIVNLEFKFLSHAHLLESLEELQKVPFCKGIIYKRFAKRCKGFISLNKMNQEFDNSGRCKACKKVWDITIKRPRQPQYKVQLLKRLHSLTPQIKLSAQFTNFLKKNILKQKKKGSKQKKKSLKQMKKRLKQKKNIKVERKPTKIFK